MPESLIWLWIPITIAAAGAQTVRNAAQRGLIRPLGTLGATSVRFIYGLPFAVAYLLVLTTFEGRGLPQPQPIFWGWVTVGAVLQIGSTICLLLIMSDRNFTLGIAYSKTELLLVAVFGLIFLGDPITVGAVVAIVLATTGILVLTPPKSDHPLRALITGWTNRTALLGLACGAGFAIAAVCYRGASLSLMADGTLFLTAGAATVAGAQLVQTTLLVAWLWVRQREVVTAVLKAWRTSLLAGFMGAMASAGWATAGTLVPVAYVRTLGVVEILFALALSHQLFKEKLRPMELAGMALLIAGLVAITLFR